MTNLEKFKKLSIDNKLQHYKCLVDYIVEAREKVIWVNGLKI